MANEIGDHIVKSYDQELKHLHDLIIEMGGLVEHQVADALDSVLNQDTVAGSQAVESDPRVDQKERDAEQFVIRLLALRQPVAGDLRQIVTSLKITGDLERIGDYAANIAKRSLVLQQFSIPYALSGLAAMSRLVQEGLKNTLDAFSSNDTEMALEVWRSDEDIDDLYNGLFRELITYMMEDPRNITPCTHLLFIAKNLERIGDHATNIAETIYYSVTGESLLAVRPKGDNSPYAVVRTARDA